MSNTYTVKPTTGHSGRGDASVRKHNPKPPFEFLDPIKIVCSAIQQITCTLLGLAEILYKKPQIDELGKPRKQSRSEIIVLVVEYFRIWLDEIGMGTRELNGQPHIYVGTHWQKIENAECQILLGEFAEKLGYDAFDSKIYTFREKLLKQMYSTGGTTAIRHDPTRVPINFRNGTLDISQSTERLREFQKADNLRYRLPFDFDEQASCPMFDKYLLRVLPDPQSQNVLSEFLGWIFLRDLKLEKALFLLGSGHNGKSVFFEVINALLGDQNVSNMGLSSLSKLENRFVLGPVLLNFGSEINDRCDVDLFKKLTSGEPVEARRRYKDTYIMRDYARLAFAANVLPANIEHTEGFFRRFLIVPFLQTISAEEKDPDLARKIIEAELPGIFNWVMQGLRRLRTTRRFSTCQASENAIASYRKEHDTVALFLDESGLQSSPDGKLSKDQVYTEYRRYCSDSGYKIVGKGEFGKRLLRDHHIDDSKSGSSRFWRLARLHSEESIS
jgi:putative DNA primase/helicase